MKRIVTLLLAAGLVFGAFSGAQAADIKAKGAFEAGFEWNDNTNFKSSKHDNSGEDDFAAYQRLRTQIDIVASEALSGTVYFEIGGQAWGKEDGGLGADGKVVKVRRSYIDWTVPQTDLKVRMGIQGMALPSASVVGSPILEDDAAALTLSYAFNDNVSAALFWARPYNLDSSESAATGQTNHPNTQDEMDLIGLSVPVKLDGVAFNPWMMYGMIGKDVLNGVSGLDTTKYNASSKGHVIDGMYTLGGATFEDNATAFWGGSTFELSMFDPFSFKADAMYGKLNAEEDSNDRAGWLLSAKAAYKLGMVTPALFAWYGTGENDDLNDGSERMPSISPSWGATSFGYAGSFGVVATDSVLGDNGTGTWALGLELGDISFIENLSHVFRVAYVKGTNSEEAIKAYVADSGSYARNYGVLLSEEDSAWEVNFDHTYKIYENLQLVVEMGYVKLNLDEDVWSTQAENMDDAWKLNFQFMYSF